MQNEPETHYTKLPEAMDRADIGPYLASLREHYKLDIHDVATHLHMRVKYVEAIEQSAFDSLPNAVYARGFVRQYAEFLGIDPEQAVAKCFGPQPEKKESYFIPERSRKSATPMRVWLSVLAVGFCAYAIYDYSSLSDDPYSVAAQTAIPERFMQAARNRPFFVGEALRCATGVQLTACMELPTRRYFSLVGNAS